MKYFKRAIPEDMGIHSLKIKGFLDALDQVRYNMHSFMLIRHGKVVAEVCRYPYEPEDRRLVYSASKTFTGTAVGIACDRGLLKVSDRVLSYFPEEDREDLDPRARLMTVGHLLTMTTGHGRDSIGDMCNLGGDWTRTFFTREMVCDPGTKFVYDSGASYMLSEIVSRVAGMKMSDFLRDSLLEPLRIKDFSWEVHGAVNTGGWGVLVRPEDLAKLGMLYLHKGVFEGKRILSETWVSEATSSLVETGRDQYGWSKGYGYQIWMSTPGSFRANGAFGQYCMVFPQADMILAATSEEGDAARVFPLVEEFLLSDLEEKPVNRDPVALRMLMDKLKEWEKPNVFRLSSSYLEALLPGRRYAVWSEKSESLCGPDWHRDDPDNDHELNFEFLNSHMTFSIDGRETIESSCFGYLKGKTHYVIMPPSCSPIIGEEQMGREWSYAACHRWINDTTLLLTICFRETGHNQQWLFVFTGDRIHITVSNSCKGIFGLMPEAQSDWNKDFGDMSFSAELKK